MGKAFRDVGKTQRTIISDFEIQGVIRIEKKLIRITWTQATAYIFRITVWKIIKIIESTVEYNSCFRKWKFFTSRDGFRLWSNEGTNLVRGWKKSLVVREIKC